MYKGGLDVDRKGHALVKPIKSPKTQTMQD